MIMLLASAPLALSAYLTLMLEVSLLLISIAWRLSASSMPCSMVTDPVAEVRTLGFDVTNAPSPVRKNSMTRGGGDGGGVWLA